MFIHEVKPGETINSIADQYDVSVVRLIEDNGLLNHNNLVVGQAIVIVYPEQTYTVQEGDTLVDIADAFGVSLMQLLRNNPNLSGRELLYPGETIVISYDTNYKLSTNGYAYSFINKDILRKTLPFLTYLTIFNYRTIEGGEIIGEDVSEIIQIAKDYGVAPLMSLSTVSLQGSGNIEIAYSILYNEVLQERHIDNILKILEDSGFYGLSYSLIYLNLENRKLYENFVHKLTYRLNQAGYPVFITVTPRTIIDINEIKFENFNYYGLSKAVNGIMFFPYEWGYYPGSPTATTNILLAREFLDYATSLMEPQKIYFGISIIAYNWELPYVLGVSRAKSLTYDAAISLAIQTGATIQFEENSQAPYFEYVDYSTEKPKNHIVWFVDARSVDAFVKLVPEYGLNGISIWNIMNYFAPMWLVINSQYKIEKLLPEY